MALIVRLFFTLGFPQMALNSNKLTKEVLKNTGKPDLTRNPIDPLKNDPFWPVTCLTRQPDWLDLTQSFCHVYSQSTFSTQQTQTHPRSSRSWPRVMVRSKMHQYWSKKQLLPTTTTAPSSSINHQCLCWGPFVESPMERKAQWWGPQEIDYE